MPPFRILAALILAIAHAGSLRAAESSSVQLSLDPPLASIRAGERRLVSVRARGIPGPGLAAFQITLRYDPATIAVLDPNRAHTSFGLQPFAPLGGSPLCAAVRGAASCPDPPWALTAGGRQAVGSSWGGKGRVSIAYATTGEGRLATGAGALAILEVVGIVEGPVTIEIESATLGDDSEPPRTYGWRP
ncbi:MAG: cohesin domain-containing protein [Myxococcota bacterium]